MHADAHFVHVGGADASGLYAVSIATGESRRVADGSFWRVTADESGVYAAEPTNQSVNAGAVFRFE